MKTFTCICGNTLHFENTACLACGRTLAFVPGRRTLTALDPAGDGLWRASADGAEYRLCRNYSERAVCNWALPADESAPYCLSCRLSQVIPALDTPGNEVLWARIEAAKRRLLYTLLGLGLPLVDKATDPQRGLAFRFLEDATGSEFDDDLADGARVLTGHVSGTVTINIAEADPSTREAIRERLNEPYRTLLGHFRHEVGHYYWYRLLENHGPVDQARALFGDEREGYDEALQRYYREGPPTDWYARHITAYASAHPWEDWAETFAHYLHIVDTSETAAHAGLTLHRTPLEPVCDQLRPALENWGRLTVTLNELNRSLGLPDPYPFAVGERAAEKLEFVHRLVRHAGRASG